MSNGSYKTEVKTLEEWYERERGTRPFPQDCDLHQVLFEGGPITVVVVVDPKLAEFTDRKRKSSVHLLEADVLGVLMEALTAHVEAVFADQTVTVAVQRGINIRPLTWKKAFNHYHGNIILMS